MRFQLPITLTIFLSLILLSSSPTNAQEDPAAAAAPPADGVNGETPPAAGSDDASLEETNAGPDSEPEAEPEPESEPEEQPVSCQICSGTDCSQAATEICELGYSCGQTILTTSDNADGSGTPTTTFVRSCMEGCKDNEYGRCHSMGNATTCVMCCHSDNCNSVGADHEAFSGTMGGKDFKSSSLILLAACFLQLVW